MIESPSAAAPTARFSRRALFGLGGSTLLVATAATVWRWRTQQQAEAATPSRSDAPITYADHDGWMVTVAEKRTLLLPPPGPSR